MDSDRFTGMTNNERLFAAGLLDEWDQAALARERERMCRILEQAELTPAEAQSVVDAVLADPARYGF